MITIGGLSFDHNVFCAPGARGYDGGPQWYDQYLKYLGKSWENTNLAGKTGTQEEWEGNMPLTPDGLSPFEYLPRSVYFNVWSILSAHALNCVGLSNPGLRRLLDDGILQGITETFVMSRKAVAPTPEERLQENHDFVDLLSGHLHEFKAPFAIHDNHGCPNVAVSPETGAEEPIVGLRVLRKLGVPLILATNALFPAETFKIVQDTGLCDAWWLGNTIDYDYMGMGRRIFHRKVSPMLTRGLPHPKPGGWSGPRLWPISLNKCREAREVGVDLPIILNGGLWWAYQIYQAKRAGATAVAMGMTGPTFRPVFMRSTIWVANRILGN